MQPENDERRSWMSRLASAPPQTLAALWEGSARAPTFAWLRKPEIGTVMVRGRAGGSGAAFNLGEMTVTRCALQIEAEESVGHALVQGRDPNKARIAALVDALMQTDAAPDLRDTILAPLAEATEAAERTRAEKAAATKVDFFTMARGED